MRIKCFRCGRYYYHPEDSRCEYCLVPLGQLDHFRFWRVLRRMLDRAAGERSARVG